MKIWFARHAQPAWAVDGVSQEDPHLTSLGHEQAALLAKRLAQIDEPFTELLVSSAIRAQETAAPIADALGLEPSTIAGLTEIRLPDWRDTPEEAVQQIFADALRRQPEEWWDGLPGGESFLDFHDRVSNTILGLLGERGVQRDSHDPTQLWRVASPDEKLLVVAHGGTNAVALGFLLGAEPTPWEWDRFVLGHASLATLESMPLGGGHILSLRSFNDQEHIPIDIRTR
jgi:probable phosphoglycerate mutase